MTGETGTVCYYDTGLGLALCEGELWQCQSCGETYCQFHSHATSRGCNVECVMCERERLSHSEEVKPDDS